MYGPTAAQYKDAFVAQRRKSPPDGEVAGRVEMALDRELDDWHIRFRVHQADRYLCAMVQATLAVDVIFEARCLH